MDELFVVRGEFQRARSTMPRIEYLNGYSTEEEALEEAQRALRKGRERSADKYWSRLLRVTVTRETTIADEEV